MPVPRSPLVLKNGSKIRSTVSGAMPVPVSAMASLDVGAGLQPVDGGLLGGHRPLPRRHPERAAGGHRVRGVDHQVHHDLLQTGPVHHHLGQSAAASWKSNTMSAASSRRSIGSSSRASAETSIRDAEVWPRRANASSWRVSSAARSAASRICSRSGCAEASSGARRQPACVAGDDRQEVVEVMGDPAGQLPDGLHLLRLGEPGGDLLALGDVGDDAAQALDAAVGVAGDGDDVAHLPDVSVGRDHPVQQLEVLALAGRLHEGERRQPILGVHQRHPEPGLHPLRRADSPAASPRGRPGR